MGMHISHGLELQPQIVGKDSCFFLLAMPAIMFFNLWKWIFCHSRVQAAWTVMLLGEVLADWRFHVWEVEEGTFMILFLCRISCEGFDAIAE